VADVGDRGQVVADEEMAHAQRPLQVLAKAVFLTELSSGTER
jgi:hypothetical protein